MTLWGITTESRDHPKYITIPERLLGVAWIIFCLHINSWYRAGLAMSLASGPLYEDITVSELYKSDITLLLPIALEDIVGEHLNEHRGRRFHCSSEKEDCLLVLRDRKKSALLINSNLMMVEDQGSRLIDRQTGLSIVRRVPGRVLTYPIQMYMTKGHLLLPTFNEILQRIPDTGFPRRYLSDLLWRLRQRRRRARDDEPLSLGHLAGAFVLLAFGLTVALVVALFEVWRGKGYSRRVHIIVRRNSWFL